uniref:TIAM Rac1 associated GEF 1b n=1 Tax=Astyanax mexicanus TaxID=7994 RepID=A0A8B9GRV3_ASTMX
MGNVESQCGSHGFYGDRQRQLSRKRVSRSLRLSGKQSYHSRHVSSGKPEHRNSETSTRSSSTPSIPQSLAEHGLEPFDDNDGGLPDFSGPIWVDRVAMNLRPMTFHTDPTGTSATPQDSTQDSTQDGTETHGGATSSPPRDTSGFKKNSTKRSKSADMWREDSLEVSLSDASLENLTSMEEITDVPDSTRANSLDELYGQQSHGRYAKRRKSGAMGADSEEDKMLSPCDDDGTNYGAFTLPCRRSHCLSEGLTSYQGAMQGRRAQTIQDVTAGDGSEMEDSGIDGLIGDSEVPQPRRYKAMSASFSAYSTSVGGAFAGSDSGSSSGAGAGEGVQGVYENFRQELEKSVCQMEPAEKRASGLSDEQSSITLSSAYHTEPMLVAAGQGSVRKAGRLTIKNLLVHKKNKKVELAARRKWKSYWTCSQTELENWVTAIHSACAAAFARQHHREDTVRLLRSEIRKLEQKIDMDEKMKKMGDMQLASVTDTKKRKTILEQIFLWEQNLEQFHMDLFRFRCYLSSLQGGELPNPKRLLAFASRPTKLAMGRLGIFSVSSFHALVAARTECGVRRRPHAVSRSTSKRKSRFSSLWGLETSAKRKNKTHPSIEQVFAEGEEPVKRVLEGMFEESSRTSGAGRPGTEQDTWTKDHLTPSWVCLPNGRPVLAIIRPGESALDTLETICKAHGLDPTKHYLRLKFLIEAQVQFYIPKPEEDVYDLLYKEIELCSKIRKIIQFDRDESCMIGYGFSISVVEDDSVQQLYITDVKAGGLAFAKGLNAGDEILQLNGKNSSTLTFSDMKAAFSQASLSLTVNTLPLVDRRQHCFLPPRRSDSVQHLYTDIFSQNQALFGRLNQTLVGLYTWYGSFGQTCKSLGLGPVKPTPDSANSVLFGMRTKFGLDPNGLSNILLMFELNGCSGAKILFSLGGSFLYYADRFKIYSAFCASHTKVPKVLVKAKTDPAFKAFLDERNPKQQHSSTLESYLIKPIQRVLKYPLLLRELYTLTDPDSEEHYHLDVAMKAMNKVASHINEMQKLHEEFGAVFDQLISEQTGEKKEVADLSMGDLLLNTSVTWLNPPSSLGKWKKEPQLATFVFKTAVVFVCKDFSKQKKKIGGSHRASISGEERDPFRFRHMISTSALQVRALSGAVCEIIHIKSESEGRPERVFHLCCRSDRCPTLITFPSSPPFLLYLTISLWPPLFPVYFYFFTLTSAPTRTLGRRKLVRNRFTIDTDIVFDADADADPDSPDSQHALQPGDTDRWVEEQFDLQRYEEQEQVKETDILSDEEDDEEEEEDLSRSALSPATPDDVEGQISALSLGEDEQAESDSKDSKSQHAMRLSHLGKQCAVSVASVDDQPPPGDEVVWVRRDVGSPDSDTQNTPES